MTRVTLIRDDGKIRKGDQVITRLDRSELENETGMDLSNIHAVNYDTETGEGEIQFNDTIEAEYTRRENGKTVTKTVRKKRPNERFQKETDNRGENMSRAFDNIRSKLKENLKNAEGLSDEEAEEKLSNTGMLKPDTGV